MSQTPNTAIAVIGKNSFHVVGHDARGAIVLRQKARLAHIPPCLIGMEACVAITNVEWRTRATEQEMSIGTNSTSNGNTEPPR